MVFCIAEDRASEEPGIRLLLLSLLAACPDSHVKLFFPAASDAFVTWMSRFASQGRVDLERKRIFHAEGWDVKPDALLTLLDAGHAEVVWLDSDIVVDRDFRPLLEDPSGEILVACEEPYWGQHQGGVHRTQSWGLVPGRSLQVTVNTGVMRVTPHHRDLLTAWKELLRSDAYRHAQQQPLRNRPIHLLSDQEVLTALLGSERFCTVKLRQLRRGADVIQYLGPAGYSPGDRMASVFTGLPPLIHAIGKRPWWFTRTPSAIHDLRAWYDALGLELSPFNSVAARFAGQLQVDAQWVRRRTLVGRLLRLLSGSHPALCGLPLAIVDHFFKAIQALLKLNRFAIAPSPVSQRQEV